MSAREVEHAHGTQLDRVGHIDLQARQIVTVGVDVRDKLGGADFIYVGP